LQQTISSGTSLFTDFFHRFLEVLKQCEGNFTRENIMKQAASLHDLEIPTLLPGIKVKTSPTNYRPIRQMQLAKFDGTSWKLFGDVITGAGN
jgi:branched-chain amino acid transport system substrate-binding protein